VLLVAHLSVFAASKQALRSAHSRPKPLSCINLSPGPSFLHLAQQCSFASLQKDKSDGAARENVRNVPKNTDDHDNDDDDLLFFNTDIIGKDFWEAYPHLLRDD